MASSMSRKRANQLRQSTVSSCLTRWKRDLNPCRGICSPLPRLSAIPPGQLRGATERTTGLEPATLTLARLCATNCATSAKHPNCISTAAVQRGGTLQEHSAASQTEVSLVCRAYRVTVQAMQGSAVWQGHEYRDPVRAVADWDIDSEHFWFLAATFEGQCVAVAFRERVPLTPSNASWPGVPRDAWTSSLDGAQYCDAVRRTREYIAAGDVYQANICRVLSAPIPSGSTLRGLWRLLHARHGAPFSGYIDIPAGQFDALPDGLGIVSSSPELFLQRRGMTLLTAPIKGTAPTESELLPKDRAENLMIVDLMRNDLASISRPGTVSVPKLFALEPHPGLVHLVSYVQSRVDEQFTWEDVRMHLLPPGSVSGAPKSSAVRIIEELEGRTRGFYCGAFGIAHGDEADLAVGIRSFFRVGDRLEFGTGAGITWGSDPHGEWLETELKAARLLAVASEQGSAK